MSMAPSVVVPILEDYYPAQTGDSIGSYQSSLVNHGVGPGCMAGSIPADYHSMVRFLVCLIAQHDSVETNTEYAFFAGQHGQSYDHIYKEGAVIVTYVANQTLFVDLTAEIPTFIPGDIYGIEFNPADADLVIHILGTKITYRPNHPVQ